ncbi:hypothetical protein NA57DRAFT_51658 [Rhizodiscina lignyota]|uniref:Uncharacterized protein n=1 Tax=Rhizodiscina lignyota TaxID=1504668 RepID=A0A9P4MEW5_9PEZI|nr:hypothetical protein NA57DRAFT_51658 [Rhizodiscina lignyota]
MTKHKSALPALKVPATLWLQCGGDGPAPTFKQFEQMEKGDWSLYEKEHVPKEKRGCGWREDLTLLFPMGVRRLQMEADRIKVVSRVQKAFAEEAKKDKEEKKEKGEEKKKKSAEAEGKGEDDGKKAMQKEIRKLKQQNKTLRAALNKALSDDEDDEEPSGGEGKKPGPKSEGSDSGGSDTTTSSSGSGSDSEGLVVEKKKRKDKKSAHPYVVDPHVVVVPHEGSAPSWRHVPAPPGAKIKRRKKLMLANPEVEVVEVVEEVEDEGVSDAPAILFLEGSYVGDVRSISQRRHRRMEEAAAGLWMSGANG